MTDIQKMIEEEAREYAFQQYKDDEYTETILFNETINDFKAGANFALSQLQHANRWRKVSEEMPGKDVDVLIKFDNNNISIGKYKSEEYFSCINGDEYTISEVTEWKPIE